MPDLPLATAYVDIVCRDKYSAALRNAENRLGMFGRNTRDVFHQAGRAMERTFSGLLSPITKLGGALKGLYATSGLLAAGGATAGLAVVVKNAAHMETQLAKLARVSGLTGNGLRQLGEELKKTSTQMGGVTLDEALGIAQFSAKMGVAGPKLGMFTRDIMMFSQVIDGMEPEDAASKIARLGQVFGDDATQARKYAAALVALDDASTATASDILSISSRIAPIARLLGMNPQRTMALAATARETGVAPEVAGTALSQTLAKMADPKTQWAFARLAQMRPLAFKDLMKDNPGDALMKVAKGLQGMDAGKGVQALTNLGIEGQRARQVMLALATAVDKEAQFNKIAKNEWEMGVQLQKKAALASGTLEAQWKRVDNAFQIVTSRLGEALLPTFKRLAESLVALMMDISKTVEANAGVFQAWAKKIGDVVDVIGVAWSNAGLFFDYFEIVVREKLMQAGEIMRRFGNKVMENLRWLSQNSQEILLGMAEFFLDLGKQIGANLLYGMAESYKNLDPILKGALKVLVPAVNALEVVPKPAPVKPNVGLLPQLPAGPGFGGMNAPLPGLGNEKANAWGRIVDARKAQADRIKADAAAQAAADDAARRGPGPGWGAVVGKIFRGVGGKPLKPDKDLRPAELRRRRNNQRLAALRAQREKRKRDAELAKARKALNAKMARPVGKAAQAALEAFKEDGIGGLLAKRMQAEGGKLTGKAVAGGLGVLAGDALGRAVNAGADGVKRLFNGVPGGKDLIKDGAAPVADPQASLKKQDDMIAALRNVVGELQGIQRKGIPILV